MTDQVGLAHRLPQISCGGGGGAGWGGSLPQVLMEFQKEERELVKKLGGRGGELDTHWCDFPAGTQP